MNLFTSNGGFVGIYDQHRSSALEAYKSGKRYVMRGDGYGTTDVGLFFKEPISNEVDHMEEAVIQPFMMTNGLTEDTTVQFQMLASVDLFFRNFLWCLEPFPRKAWE